MPWIDRIPPDEADDGLRDIYQEIGGASGEVASILRIQPPDPFALRAHYRL